MTRKPIAKKPAPRASKAAPPVRRATKAAGGAGKPLKAVKPRGAAPDPVDDLVTAMAHALDLPLEPEWRDAIKFNLALTLRHAARVAEFKLPDEAEPGPVFRA